MKRITKKSLEKLNKEQITNILKEKQEEKKYFLKLSMDRSTGKRLLSRYDNTCNTLDNQIYLINTVLNERFNNEEEE